MKLSRISLILALAAMPCAAPLGRAAVVINEFNFDDNSTDDVEYVELHNTGPGAVDIGGYTLGGRDAGGIGPTAVIPAGTSLGSGGYYVVGNTGVLNVTQVVASGFLENETETIELYNGAFDTGALVDAVLYEGSATALFDALSAPLKAQIVQSYWPNNTNTGTGASPNLKTILSISRYVDGIDRNNNGRDFGLRPGTPGSSNVTATMSAYAAPNVDALADGTVVPGFTASFVNARVITPGTVTAGLNPNAIPAPPLSSKAIIAWDNTGGGNAVVSDATFIGSQQYSFFAYLDTEDIPVNTNSAGVQFRGSEFTFYGLAGSIDPATGGIPGLPSVSGQVGAGAANSNVGTSGIAWYYEKVGVPVGGGAVSEKLYLIDAGDGGNMNTELANTTPDEWIVLQTIDVSAVPSGWYELGISIDAAGNGVARAGSQTFNFTTAANIDGGFYVGYRENTQDGAVGVPSYLRPPTFAVGNVIPEPATLVVAIGAVLCGGAVRVARRRSNG